MLVIPSKLMFVLHESSQGRDGQMDAQPRKAHGLVCLCQGLPSGLAGARSPNHADWEGDKQKPRRRQEAGGGVSSKPEAASLREGPPKDPRPVISPLSSAAGPGKAILCGPVYQVNQVCGRNNKSAATWPELISLICLSLWALLIEARRVADSPRPHLRREAGIC